jgi:hypothetical protein
VLLGNWKDNRPEHSTAKANKGARLAALQVSASRLPELRWAAMQKLSLSSLKGLEKFQTALANDLLRDMLGWLRSKTRAKLLIDEVHKHIFDLGPPTPPGRRTGRRNYHQLLTYHIADIQATLDTMKDVEFYMSRFPYSPAKVAKHRHLQFHGEAFLNELYILQERLLNLLTFIERQHRRDPRLDQIKTTRGVLNNWVIESMMRGIAMRGSHVHKWRMSDNRIDRLVGISLYMNMPSRKIQKAFKTYYESEYRKIRKELRGWVASGIDEAQKLVDTYSDEVFKLLFDSSGKLIYPSRLKF